MFRRRVENPPPGGAGFKHHPTIGYYIRYWLVRVLQPTPGPYPSKEGRGGLGDLEARCKNNENLQKARKFNRRIIVNDPHPF